MNRKAMGLAALAVLLFAGCANESAKEPAEKTDTPKTEESVKEPAKEPSKEDTSKVLDSYKKQAADLYKKMQELGDKALNDEQVKELRDTISSEAKSLYDGSKSAFSEAYEGVSGDEDLQKALKEMKDQTDSLLNSIAEQIDERKEMDFSGLDKAMKDFTDSFSAEEKKK